MSIKQVLCVRRDLNMRKGKIAAQCAHASMKVFLDRGNFDADGWFCFSTTEAMKEWIEDRFTKICVSVDSEQELLDVYRKAQEANIPCSLVTDAGLTEFHGVPTNTVVALGPADDEEINKITGNLKLL